MKKILFCLMAAGLMLAFSAAPVLAHSHGLSKAQKLALKAVREATKKYKDVEKALADGFLPTEDCVPEMGYHYVNLNRLLEDTYVDPFLPEILLYARDKHGELKLVGVEYFVADMDQPPPTYFGIPMDGPMPGHGNDIWHYDLHVWLFKKNPEGMLEVFNPKVSCP